MYLTLCRVFFAFYITLDSFMMRSLLLNAIKVMVLFFQVLDHDLPRKPMTLTVHFLVKFFIESISHLSENRTVELFYLQARSLIFRGTLEVDSDIVFQLAALALQVRTFK